LALTPRRALEKVHPAVHGGPDYAELSKGGIDPGSLIDFSVGLNPLGVPPGLAEKLAKVSFYTYPDSEATEFREAVARKLGLEPGNIIAGNGSSELIWLCALAYFGPRDTVVIAGPTFGEYERACLMMGSRTVSVNAEPPDFAVPVGSIARQARRTSAKAIFLCNPNNPTGSYLSRSQVEKVLDALQDTLLVLDEAYVAFTDSGWASEPLIGRGNVVILRSMTKDYGIAGLRLGYAIAAEPVISNLRKVCPPWNVNSLAQKAGVIILEEDSHVRNGCRTIRESRDFLFEELAKLGLHPAPTGANFFMVKVKDGASLRHALLRRGILVRDCASFGLPEYIRLAARTRPECEKLIAALKEVTGRIQNSEDFVGWVQRRRTK